MNDASAPRSSLKDASTFENIFSDASLNESLKQIHLQSFAFIGYIIPFNFQADSTAKRAISMILFL